MRGHGSVNSLRQRCCEWLARRWSLHSGRIARLLCDFSIAPLLLISIHLASLFLDRSAAVEGLTKELVGLIGPAGSDAIKQMLDAAGTARPHGWTGLVAIAVLLFAAAGFVGSLQDALDKIWEAPPRADGVWSFLRNKLFSFSLVLAAAFLLLVSLVLSTAMTALTGRFTVAFGLPQGVVDTVIAAANFLLSALIFAAIFKFVPSVFVTWRAAAAGGVFTAVLFALGRFALAWYLGREVQASAYGAATSLVLLLIWIYYSAQILFLGAQFSQSFQSARLRPQGAGVKFDCRRAPGRQFEREILFKFGVRSRSGLPARSRHDAKASRPAPPGEPGLLERATRLLAQLN